MVVMVVLDMTANVEAEAFLDESRQLTRKIRRVEVEVSVRFRVLDFEPGPTEFAFVCDLGCDLLKSSTPGHWVTGIVLGS